MYVIPYCILSEIYHLVLMALLCEEIQYITDFWILDESYSSQARFSADEILTFEWDTQSFIYNKYSQLFICVSRCLWCNKL